MSDKETYNRIIDYLSGSLNDAEKTKIEQWINESEEHKNLICEIELIWKGKVQDESFVKPEWEQLKLKLELRSHSLKYMYIRVAAAAVVILIIGFSWLYNQKHEIAILQTNNDSFITDTLNNGWVVYLYPNSMLTKYRKSLINKEKVTYKFSGEGFFIVPENDKTDVSMWIGDANLKIHGAVFRVNSCSAGTDFSVLVESGKIDLKMVNEPNALLINAGEKGYYSCSKKTIWKNRNEEEIYLIYQPQLINM